MNSTQTKEYTSWVEVSLSAVRHNLAEVQSCVGPSVRIMAVVKADAYGHGAIGTARAFAEAGADCFGVTTLEEGLELRKAGITKPVLVFSPLLPGQLHAALSEDMDLTVCDLELGKATSEAAVKAGKTARLHVKVDTGMGRLGVTVDECPEFMYRLLNLPGVEIAGTYTHFANAGSKNLSHAREQNARFSALIDLLKAKDIPTGLCHAANSAAVLNLPESHFDMVRPGTILYGQYPTPYVKRELELLDTWCLKTRIVALRKLAPGTKIGYGSEFMTTRPTAAAVLPIGYSDGFTLTPQSAAQRAFHPLRVLANKVLGAGKGPHVIVRRKRAPVIGRVSAQMCSIDVTDIPGAQIGDEAIVPARRTTTSSRIPRVYTP